MITSKPERSIWLLLLKTQLLTILFFILFLIISLIPILFLSYKYLENFSENTGLQWGSLYSMISQSYIKARQSEIKNETVLILGTDQLDGRNTQAILTDTIILFKIDYPSKKIKVLPIPRDLWNEPFKTKINALYSYGEEYYPEQQERFAQEAISEQLGVDIDRTIVISLKSLVTLIDIVGGVEIDVKNAFRDDFYPNENVDSTQNMLNSPYRSVEFKKGLQTFSSNSAIEYIRSRKSIDTDTGSDLARSERQLELLRALVDKLFNPRFWFSSDNSSKVFIWYQDNFQRYWSVDEVLESAFRLSVEHNNFEIINLSIPVYPDNPNGLITHPSLPRPDKIWIYQEMKPNLLKNEIPKIF